jgi:titin
LQNWLGIDSSGACGPNRYGIHIDGGAANTTILQNFISCNLQHGVFVDSLLGSPTIPPVMNTLIDTNKIGTDIAGLAPRPNQLSGIYDYQGVTTIIKNNLISGNAIDGITLDASQGTQVSNQNLVGTDATGTLALPNGANGIYLRDYTQSATIDQNVISGNLADGIFLDGGFNTSNTITRNYIGVDNTGMVALGNGDDGIQIVQANANTIGGLIPATGRNIISANGGHGINIQSASNTLV